ncbi:uncharacterized protein LY89DRAFT_194462 [Mollisia scopiformis]|uniref:Uncharacterized protein n=1 Tax=Mollisia scopiformis TaxID=149040 RepID=A0A194WXU6_MOLSC|nr:uncharacterized protein LY89DRAFT_194462 [Mollisia scopiformis]KUJ12801.1 hypothetical protein LY89DRAFT_194462 [Mollisia scopiformis]
MPTEVQANWTRLIRGCGCSHCRALDRFLVDREAETHRFSGHVGDRKHLISVLSTDEQNGSIKISTDTSAISHTIHIQKIGEKIDRDFGKMEAWSLAQQKVQEISSSALRIILGDEDFRLALDLKPISPEPFSHSILAGSTTSPSFASPFVGSIGQPLSSPSFEVNIVSLASPTNGQRPKQQRLDKLPASLSTVSANNQLGIRPAFVSPVEPATNESLRSGASVPEAARHDPQTADQFPRWLILGLQALANSHPNDRFQVEMKNTIVDKITEVPCDAPLPAGKSFSDHRKFMVLPQINCMDCPGEPHFPGPGQSVRMFASHLETVLHRTRVELAIASGRERVAPGTLDRVVTSLSYPSLAKLPRNCSLVARRSSEKQEVRDLELCANTELVFRNGNRSSKLEAALAYTRGEEAKKVCMNCARLGPNDPFQKCIVMPNEFEGACTNCRYNNAGNSCSLQRSIVVPRKPRKSKTASAEETASRPPRVKATRYPSWLKAELNRSGSDRISGLDEGSN